MDIRYLLNDNPQIKGFIYGWIAEYLNSIHLTTDLIDDIDIEDYHVNFCTIYRTERDSFTVGCKSNVKYLIKSEGISCSYHLNFWIDGIFTEDTLLVGNFKTHLPNSDDDYIRLRLDLIPYMSKLEYEGAAKELIKKYYPEYQLGSAIEPLVIANRMGLNVAYLNIAAVNPEQKGMVKFDTEPVQVLDYETGEILEYKPQIGDLIIDAGLLDPSRLGELNNTILHECTHWEYHWLYFKLKKLMLVCYGSTDLIPVNTINDAPEYSMECQAKGIAARTLMPKEEVEKLAIASLGSYSQYGFSNVAELKQLSETVKLISRHFNASKESAKYRLDELGFTKNSSVFNFVEGRYIPNYIISIDGTVLKNQTYHIAYSEFIDLLFRDEELAELVREGIYVFADNFVCKNDMRFLKVNEFGRLTLTEFALSDIGSACLAFEFKNINSGLQLSVDYEFTLFKLDAASCGRILTGFSDHTKELTGDNYQVALDGLNKHAHEIVDVNYDVGVVLHDRTLTFKQCLLKIIEIRGYDKQEFLERTNLDRNVWPDLSNDKSVRYSEKKLLRLFIGLQIPGSFLNRFFECAGIVINPLDKKYLHLQQLISMYHGMGIDDFEDMLEKEQLFI